MRTESRRTVNRNSASSATSTTSHTTAPALMACPVPPVPSAAAPGADLGEQRRSDLEQVADDEQVRDLPDRRVRIPIHGDDRVRRLHPDPVLHGARDAEPEIERR